MSRALLYYPSTVLPLTNEQVALRWVTQQGVVAVTASNRRSYDADDLNIFDFTLSDDEMATLTAI